MEHLKLKLSPQEVFSNKKSFSKKIFARVLRVNQEISQSFDKFEIANAEDQKLFFNAVNHYYSNLCVIIFHLRQVVIKIVGDHQGICDLQNVIIELSKIVVSLQESLNLETMKIKILLKKTMIDIGSQVENLMKIIAKDNLHEHKQKILDCQNDLVIAAEALQLYHRLWYLSVPELQRLLHEIVEKVKNNLFQIQTGHELLIKDFSHYTRHSVQHLNNTVDYVRKMNIENFHDDVAIVFQNAQDTAIDYITELLGTLNSDNPMKKMLNIIENCHKNVNKVSNEFQKGFKLAMVKNIEQKDKVIQLITYMFIGGLNGMYVLNRSIEDAIMKK